MAEIAILGCGITGMMTALALANRGIKTCIIEKSKSDAFPLDVRTTTFTTTAKRFFEDYGIWQFLEQEAGILNEIYIVDNKSPRMLHLENDNGKARGFVVPNMYIKESLYEAVKSNPMIDLKKGVDYGIPSQENGMVVINKDITANVALVCDGRNSVLKEIFPAKSEKSYNQKCIVVEVSHEKFHEGCAVEHFMPSGPFAVLPMKNSYQSSIVWCEPSDVADLYIQLSIPELEMHLQERMGEYLGKVKIISEVQAFQLTARVVKKYYRGNIVLIGDAAHSTHPLAGQGLNQGIKDIECLVSIFAKRLKFGLEIDEMAFVEYEKSRSRDNYAMYLVTDNLNRIFSNNIFPLAFTRKLWLSIFNEFPWIKKHLSDYGSGVR